MPFLPPGISSVTANTAAKLLEILRAALQITAAIGMYGLGVCSGRASEKANTLSI